MAYKDSIKQQRQFSEKREGKKRKKKVYYGDGSYTEADFQNYLSNHKPSNTYSAFAKENNRRSIKSEALEKYKEAEKPFISITQEELNNKFGGQTLGKASDSYSPLSLKEIKKTVDFNKEVEKDRLKSERRREINRAFAAEHPVIGTGLAAMADIGSVLGAVRAGADTLLLQKTNPYSGAFAFNDYAEGLREGVKESTEIPDDVVDLGISILSSGGRALAGGLVGTALAGGASASSSFRDAKERGASDLKAKGYGLVQGLIEAGTEKYSIEGLNAFKNEPVKSMKTFFKNLGKQMITEGSEETASEILGNISDSLIMKEASNYNLYKNYLLAQGYSEEEAEKGTFKEMAKNIGKAAVGGAISGGVLGGSLMGTNTLLNSIEGKKSKLIEGTTYREFANSIDVNPQSYVNQKGVENTEALEKAEQLKAIAEELAIKEENGQKINNLEKAELEYATDNLLYTALQSEEDYYSNLASNNSDDTIIAENETIENKAENPLQTIDEAYSENFRELPNTSEVSEINNVNGENYNNISPVFDEDLQTFNEGFLPINEGFAPMSEMDLIRNTPVTLESLASETVSAKNAPTETRNIRNPYSNMRMPYSTDIKETVDTFGSSMPKNATDVMVSMYDGNVDMGLYMQAFKRAYNAGKNNVTLSTTNNGVLFGVLNDEQIKAAYKAGAQDRNKEIEKAKSIRTVPKRSKKGGLNKVSENATEEQKKLADKVGKRTGLIINISEDVDQAEYDPNKKTITISPYSKNFNQSLTHELTHYLQDSAPNAYRKFKETVVSALMEAKNYDYDQAYALYEKAYEQVDVKDIDLVTDEMVADATGLFFNDAEFINNIVKDNRSIATKIRDFFMDIVEAIERMISKENIRDVAYSLKENKAKYRMAYNLWNDALIEASNNEVAEDASEDIRYQLQNLKIKHQLDMGEPIERTKNLVAIHNVTQYKAEKMLKYDGIPMPSIAITKADMGHDNFGEISFIFGSETIDPEFDKRNKVYGADAWTPMFPKIEFEMDEKKTDEIRGKLNTLSESLPPTLKENIRRVNLNLQDEDYLTRHGGVSGVITSLEDDKGLQAAFLASNGINVKNHEKTIVEEISNEKKSAYNSVIKEFRDDFEILDTTPVTKEIRERFFKAYRDGLIKGGAEEKRADALIKRASSFAPRYRMWVNSIRDYKKDSSPKTHIETDFEAINNEIDSKLNKSEYKKWLAELFDGLEKSKGLWNGKEIITPSGNRRTFKQLHYPLTVENIVKAMLAQSDDVKNDMGFFGSKSIRAAASKDFKNIEDMHKSEGKLKNISEEEYAKADSAYNDTISSIMNNIINRSGRDDAMSSSYLGDVIIEAVRKDISSKNIVKTLNKYRWNISKTEADELSDIFNKIKNAPTKIFEAKPQRVVGYDEVKAVLVPDDIDSSIVDKMHGYGIDNIIEYEANNESDRLSKLQSLDNIRFQLDIDNTSLDTEALVNANKELQETEKYLTQQLASKNNHMPNRQDINKIAKNLVEKTDSWKTQREVADKLYTFYNYIHNNDYLDGSEVSAIAKDIAGDLLAYSKNDFDGIQADMFNELKSYLQKTNIKMPDKEFDSEFASKGGLNEFRKKYFGILKLNKEKGSPVDTAYTELSERFPELFPYDIFNPADQLIQIGETIDMLRPVTKFNEELDEITFDEASYLLGQEIIDAYFDVRYTPGKDTKLDKRSTALREYKRKLKAEYTDEIARLKKETKTLNKELSKQQKENAKTKDYYWDRVDKLEKKQEDLKDKHRLEKQAIANLNKQRIQKIRDNNKSAQYKATIKKDLKEISNMLLKPTDKKHVPEVLRAPLADFLTSVQFMGSKTRSDGTETYTWKEWQKLQDAYESISKSNGVVEEGGYQYYLNIDDDVIAKMKKLKGDVENMGDIKEFTSSQYEALKEIIRAIKKTVTDADKLLSNARYQKISELGENTLSELKKLDDKKTSAIVPIRALDRLTNNSMLDSYSRFETFGDASLSVYDELREGLNQKIRYTKEGQDFFENLMKKHNVTQKTLREWSGDDAKLIKVKLSSGETVEMKPSQAMSLYELLKRNQALDHIFVGGIVIKETKVKGKVLPKIIKSTHSVKVTQRDVMDIVGELTKEQKDFADGIAEFFDKHTSKWGNQASLQLYGYEKFKAKDYFPIKVHQGSTNTADEDISKIADTLKNLGMTKGPVPHASNPLVLEDIFDVFTKHVDQMGSYGAFVVPLSDMRKWINYKQPEFKNSIKDELSAKFGEESIEYILDLSRDINGVKENNAMDNPTDLMKTFKSSAVGLNLKVAAQQPTAYIRAADAIDTNYLVKALSVKADKGLWDRVKEYSPIAQWKDWGYFETNVGKSMKHIVLGTDSKYEKARENQMYLAGKADQLTWERLWIAAELEIKDTTELTEGTEEFYKAVGKRFDEIIDQTQVVDSVLHRSNIMKRTDVFTKMATAFMAEPIKSFNMLFRATFEFIKAKTPEARARAKTKIIRSSISFTMSQTANSVIGAIFRAMRDDDKEKEFHEKLAKYFGDEMLDNMNPLKMIVYIKDVISVIEGFSVKRNDVVGYEELVNLLRDMRDDIEKISNGEELSETPYGIMRKYLSPISSFTGIGIDNLERDVRALINTAFGLAGADDMLYNSEKLEKNIKSEKNLSNYMGMAFNAYMDGNDELGDKIINDLVKAGIPQEKIDSRYKSFLKKEKYQGIKGNTKMQFYSEINKAGEDGSVTDREVREIALDMMKRGVSESEAYDLYRSRRKDDKKLDDWMSMGNEFDDFLESKNYIEDIKEKYKGTDNKEIRQEHVVDYIDSLNLNEESQKLLWEIAGYKVTENSYFKYF